MTAVRVLIVVTEHKLRASFLVFLYVVHIYYRHERVLFKAKDTLESQVLFYLALRQESLINMPRSV
jgi:hypothetical protein